VPDLIPFTPSDNNYSIGVPLDGVRSVFDNVHWNATDNDGRGAWYFDLREDDGTPICIGIKAVLGIPFGGASTHPFFKGHILKAVDTSGKRLEAGYDDLGARVQVQHFTLDEAIAPRSA
jgi:hypothetical protein